MLSQWLLLLIEKMKYNRYVHIVPLDESHHVIFNGLTKDFLPIKNKYLDSYILIMKEPNKYYSTHKTLIEKLLNSGFILEDNFNERDILVNERYEYVNAPEYKTSIIPTFECNYKCWYCIQKRELPHSTEIKSDLIIRHVKKYLIENNIRSYVLSWFGGEPLMKPDVIDFITQELKHFCNQYGIYFSAAVTSNGALLTKEVITMLKKNSVNYYQIAIDGDLPNHDKVKFDELNSSSFGLILTNVSNLLKINPEAKVVLRLNYTMKMLESERFMDDLNRYLSLDLRKRLSIDLQRVWQIKEETIPIEKLKNFQQRLSDSGYILNTDHVFSMCYMEKKHYNMIYYNGGVEKCDKRSINNLRGFLDNKGNIVWREKPIFHSYDLFDDNCICGNCVYYPLCYCGCPVAREEEKIVDNKIICGHYGDYSIFKLRIQDYCWRVILNNKVIL